MLVVVVGVLVDVVGMLVVVFGVFVVGGGGAGVGGVGDGDLETLFDDPLFLILFKPPHPFIKPASLFVSLFSPSAPIFSIDRPYLKAVPTKKHTNSRETTNACPEGTLLQTR